MKIDDCGVYIDLAGTQRSPWCCTKLKSLTVSVSGCVLPPVDAEGLSYYDRPAPIALSQAEAEHFTQLERLYIQIGRLTELRHLDITMIKLNEEGEVDWHWKNPDVVPCHTEPRKHLARPTGILKALFRTDEIGDTLRIGPGGLRRDQNNDGLEGGDLDG